ncbi:MAG TPA: alpha/beta hydrolase-fold protein [Gaiellales bacterium]
MTAALGGRVERHEVEWPQLVGNYLGDPATRTVITYLPAAYVREPERRFPVVHVLHGYTMDVESWVTPTSLYGGYLPEVDRLISSGELPPMILVFVDGFTRLGGSQYVDSPGSGDYLSYLVDGVVPWADATFRTLARAGSRAIQGHSSGGFGALYAAWSRPELFGAVAPSAPDSLYEVVYPPVFAHAVELLRAAGTTYDAWSSGSAPIADDGDLMMCKGVSACFSPAADGTEMLPFDPETGRLDDPVWARWLALDPVRLIGDDDRFPRVPVFLSVGTRDEFGLHAGVRALERLLVRKGVDVVVTTADVDHCGIIGSMPAELGRIAGAIRHE